MDFEGVRLVTRLSMLIAISFGLFNLVAVAAGHARPANPALAGFTEGCDMVPQPCWYGIVPGVTHEAELQERMAFAGEGRYTYDDLGASYLLYFVLPDTMPACIFTFRLKADVVIRADIALCDRSPLRLGDVSAVASWRAETTALASSDVAFGAVTVHITGWPAPESRVSFINLLSQPEQLTHYDWHGFMPEWRYCQIEPEYPSCRA